MTKDEAKVRLKVLDMKEELSLSECVEYINICVNYIWK